MFWLIFLNFIFFSLGQLASISRGGFLNIYFFDLFLLFSNSVILFLIIKRGKFRINFPLLSFFLFVSYALIFTFIQIYYFDLSHIIQTYSYLIRFSSYFIFGYLIYSLLKSGLLNLNQLDKIFIYNFIFVTICNLLQFVFLNNLSELAQFGWDPHIGRLTGTFLDPNFMAYYLCLYFILNNYFLKNKWIEFVSIISIFLTLSRNGILTLGLIFILLNFRNLKKMVLFLLLVISILVLNPRLVDRFLQFQNSDDSSYQRVISWNEAIKVISFNNLSGVGFNNYKNNLEFYRINSLDSLGRNSVNSTDSSFLHTFVTLGIVGLFLLLIIFIGFIYQNGFLEMNTIVFISLAFNSQFINSLYYPQISFLIFLILNLGIYLREKNL